jgi:serine/threonine protein kinase
VEPGELVAGRYRLVAMVGRGAMGVVWQAHDERLDRAVAVKELLVEESERALREGRIAARLRHPNAVTVHDVVTHGGTPCLILEYLPARSLAARGPLPPLAVAAIGAQIAGALAEAHAAGIVHRDVKPENILITDDGTAKLTDFGISHAAGVGTVTSTGILAGTPAYLAPEVAAGGAADVRADVFSLGATLYAATEGTPPFGVDDNPIALLHRVASAEVTPPTRSGPLTGTLLWLLRRDPAARPSMSAAYEALASVAAGRTMAIPTPTLALALPASRVSRRAVVFGAGAAALVAAGIVVGTLIANPSTDATGTPITSSTSSHSTSSTTTTCTVSYRITNSWRDGYQADVTVSNTADEALSGWEVTWTLPTGHKINNLWGGTVAKTGADVTVTNADWNVTVPANSKLSFGLTVDTPPNDHTPPTPHCAPR